MILLARTFAALNAAIFGWQLGFRAIPRSRGCPPCWDFAHHVIEGMNGGEIWIPRQLGIVWPAFLRKRFALIVSEK